MIEIPPRLLNPNSKLLNRVEFSIALIDDLLKSDKIFVFDLGFLSYLRAFLFFTLRVFYFRVF